MDKSKKKTLIKEEPKLKTSKKKPKRIDSDLTESDSESDVKLYQTKKRVMKEVNDVLTRPKRLKTENWEIPVKKNTSSEEDTDVTESDSEWDIETEKTKKRVVKKDNDSLHKTKKLKTETLKKSVKKTTSSEENTDLTESDSEWDIETVKMKKRAVKKVNGLNKTKKLKTETLKKSVKKNKNTSSEEDIDLKGSDLELETKKRVLKKDKDDVKKPKKLKTENLKKPARKIKNTANEKTKVANLAGDIVNPSTSKCEPGNSGDYNKNKSAMIDEICRQGNVSITVAKNIVEFFDNEATIPFLVRYRGEKIGFKNADEMRNIKDVYKNMKEVEARAAFIKKTLKSKNVLTPDMEFHLEASRTLSDLEELYEPFKSSKKSRIQQAYNIGVVDKAQNLLEGRTYLGLSDIVDPKVEEIKNEELAKDLYCHTISYLILKDMELTSKLPEMYNTENIRLISAQNTSKTSKTNTKVENKFKNNQDNFAHYYNFNKHFKSIRPHQILAINRGEKQKELKVNVELPNGLHFKLQRYLFDKWLYRREPNHLRTELVTKAINTEALKKIETKIKKTIRNNLTTMGEKAGLNVFSLNLKWLLLTRPVCNHTILAIDPGYKNGCKVAVLSTEQKILNTIILNLNDERKLMLNLRDLIIKHKVTLIAIGNGTACRDVEKRVVEVIHEVKQENIDVQYTIVSEQGLSIFSCSETAIGEYPDLSPNLISAVSLAKRVIDPMGELIKIEPKHLGVGMYQHDMNAKRLDEMLNEVVSEVVSIVGINLNTAPHSLLRRVAGLSDARAKAIIKFRESVGLFSQRNQLLKVQGIGKKTFEQCAGFVRIFPESGGMCIEPLDQTIIHPEDYAVTKRFINEICDLHSKDIGKDLFIQGVQRSTENSGKGNICRLLGIVESTFNVIYEGLTKHLHYDIRMEYAEQLFRKEITTFEDLTEGQIITGRVENVTPFGAFVDIGIGRSELLPSSLNYKSIELHYGQRVSVKVSNINRSTCRVSLMLIDVLSN